MPIRRTQFTRLRALRAKPTATVTDRSPWEWHAESCSCGSPARRHAADSMPVDRGFNYPVWSTIVPFFKRANRLQVGQGAPHVPPSS